MEMKSAIVALGALAQDTRLAIFRLLVEAGPAGLPAGALAEQLAVAPATMSFHLAQLAQAGLVTSIRDGRSIIYAADFEAMGALVGYLTENCCRSQPEQCGPGCLPPARTTITSAAKGASSHEKVSRSRRGQ
ncbi:MAG: helix-turn-helix transcriptional regulator [Rhodospirillales bacterium]|nr:helix-turn-helix transcriptional regulator [Rhodospirillales bacterium]